MLRVVYVDKHTDEQQELLVDQRGHSPINPMVAMKGFNVSKSDGDVEFVHMADVEGYLISKTTPDTWENLTIASSGEQVNFIEVLPDPLDLIRSLVAELNKADSDDVNRNWLASLGLSNNEVLQYYGINELNIDPIKDNSMLKLTFLSGISAQPVSEIINPDIEHDHIKGFHTMVNGDPMFVSTSTVANIAILGCDPIEEYGNLFLAIEDGDEDIMTGEKLISIEYVEGDTV